MLVHKYITGTTAVKIATSIEQAITSGILAHGSKLPAIRQLAADLGVSPGTVSEAYEKLRLRGYVLAARRRGTVVNYLSPTLPTQIDRDLSGGTIDARHGSPDAELLPKLENYFANLTGSSKLYETPVVLPELEPIARTLFERDRLKVDQISVVHGAMDGIQRVLEQHLRPGDRVAIEDPCYVGFLDLIRSMSLTPVPVPIDAFGMLPSALAAALKMRISAIIITPRVQNPTGAALNSKRATELRKVLDHYPQVLIVEDDHAAEISGTDRFSICSPQTKHWAFVRSISKVLGPDLRLAFLAADSLTLNRVTAQQTHSSRWVSHVLQELVTLILKDRKTDKLVAYAAKSYAKRRNLLISELAKFGISSLSQSGFNIWIEVPQEGAVCQSMLSRGWAIEPGERFRLGSPPAIRITISSLTTEQIKDLAQDLATVLGKQAL